MENKEFKEQLFKKILNAKDGNYALQAEVAASIHPEGW